MDSQKQVSKWLQEEGHRKGQSYSLNEYGICVMQDSDGNECVVEVPPGGKIVYFYAPIVLVSSENKSDLFERALTMNLYGLHTNEASLAYDPKVNRIILYYSIHIEFLEEVSFSNIFNNFLLTLQKIREEFTSSSFSSSKQDSPFQYSQFKA